MQLKKQSLAIYSLIDVILAGGLFYISRQGFDTQNTIEESGEIRGLYLKPDTGLNIEYIDILSLGIDL